MKILLLEPQCSGLTHVPFNAALLRTFLVAFPEASLTFVAEATHTAHVREALGSAGAGVGWREEFGGVICGEKFTDIPLAWSAASRIRQHCIDAQVDVLVLCSAQPVLLAALHAVRPRRTAVLIFLHACLAQLGLNPLTQLLRNPLSIHTVARIPIPRGMRVVVLGGPILSNLRSMRLAASGWESLDHPYLAVDREPQDTAPLPVRFGYLAGFERNGSGTKEMLARVQRDTGCVIQWIGRESASAEALSAHEYRKRLSGVHYAVWMGDPAAYRLRASATFLDAIALGKPLVYLKNDFVDFYNRERGPLGFPVSSEAELEKLLIRLANAPLDDHYKKLSRNALVAAQMFTPGSVAPQLRAIIEEVRDETAKS